MSTAGEAYRSDDNYATDLANSSYVWYKEAAIRSRRRFRASEIIVLVTSAAIPICAVIAPRNATVPAILGAVIVVASGLSSIFHWRDNYLRFSRAREAVEYERRQFAVRTGKYEEDSTRQAVLVAAVSQIEQDEMGGWIRLASSPAKH